MYSTLLQLHSIFRWLVLLSLILSMYKSYKGYFGKREFTKTDNSIRHWTATIAHVQLLIGIIMYSQSPLVKYFWNNSKTAIQDFDTTYFALIHLFLMITAIIILTIGSALAKRKPSDIEKFKTMLLWFSIAFFIIIISIPWPFSPLANRPYFR